MAFIKDVNFFNIFVRNSNINLNIILNKSKKVKHVIKQRFN